MWFNKKHLLQRSFMKQNLVPKRNTSLSLRGSLSRQKEQSIVNLQKEWQEKYQQQHLALTKEKAEVINQLHAAQDTLSSLENFRKYQLEIESSLVKAKEQLVEQQVKEKQHLVELERKYIEQGNNLKQDYEKSLVEIRAQLEREIEEHVGSKIMHILQDNERLQEELSMHVEVTNGLQKEKSALQLENAKLTRDLDLLRQAEALHLQRSSNQARCIIESSSKVQKLEKSLGQVICQYSAERRELEEEHKRKIAALQNEKQTLKRLAQTKINELKKVRQLAQQFLKERGEVECFLLESLHQVADQIRLSKKALKKPPVISKYLQKPVSTSEEARTYFPHITPTPSSSWSGSGSPLRMTKASLSPPKSIPMQVPERTPKVTPAAGERHVPILRCLEDVPVKTAPKVDISQLSWEDKEKVLRHLFQKIHTAHQLYNQLSDATPVRHTGYELLYGSASTEETRALF